MDKKLILENAKKLQNIPQFKGYKTKALTGLFGRRLKVVDDYISSKEQKRSFILNRSGEALMCSLDTPKVIWFRHLDQERERFENDIKVQKALMIIERKLKEVFN